MKTLMNQYKKSEQYLKDFNHVKKVPFMMVVKFIIGWNTVPGFVNAIL